MKLKYLFVFFPLSFLLGCNKDRIEEDVFVEMDEFFEHYQPEVQEFVITQEVDSVTLVGKAGTELVVHSSMFDDRGVNTSLPYTVQLVELYTHKDFILWSMGSMFPTGLLTYKGAVWVNAYKDDNNFTLFDGVRLPVRLNKAHANDITQVFYGDNQINDWDYWRLNANGSTVEESAGKYLMRVGALGWNMIGNFRETVTLTDVKFNITAKGGEFVQLYAIPNNSSITIKGENLSIPKVPVGEPVVFIAFAKDKKGKFRFFRTGLTPQAVTAITIDFEEITEDRLLLQLTSLN